jgi:3-phosphoglycerate kinase
LRYYKIYFRGMKTVEQFNFAGKRALVRVDFNIPLDKQFNITDDSRIRGAVPTIQKIIERWRQRGANEPPWVDHLKN